MAKASLSSMFGLLDEQKESWRAENIGWDKDKALQHPLFY